MKGVMKFGKKGKLSPWYIEPFCISKKIGNVAYEFNLPQELAVVQVEEVHGRSFIDCENLNAGIKDSYPMTKFWLIF